MCRDETYAFDQGRIYLQFLDAPVIIYVNLFHLYIKLVDFRFTALLGVPPGTRSVQLAHPHYSIRSIADKSFERLIF